MRLSSVASVDLPAPGLPVTSTSSGWGTVRVGFDITNSAPFVLQSPLLREACPSVAPKATRREENAPARVKGFGSRGVLRAHIGYGGTLSEVASIIRASTVSSAVIWLSARSRTSRCPSTSLSATTGMEAASGSMPWKLPDSWL